MSKDQEIVITGDEEEGSDSPMAMKSYDKTLFGMLKDLRKKVAKQKEVPPYVVFQDPSLEEMATTYPTNKQELSQVNGIGMGKVNKFGKPFIELITKYVADNNIETAADVVVKTSGTKSKNKILIIQQIDRKISLDEIAESLGVKFSALITEIENICYSGTKLNIDYYIEQLMDEDRQDEIYDYFLDSESDGIDLALDEFEGEYTEDEIRLMRVKFMSEYAN